MPAKCYIAGPMRGYPRWNFDAFDRAAEEFRNNGWIAVSPADIDRALGFDPDGPDDQVSDEFLKKAILRDIEVVLDCDAIVLLPGWEESSGVAIELAAAKMMRLEVIHYKQEEPPKSRIDGLLQMHRDTTKECLGIMRRKNHDYTSGSFDPFANFRASEAIGIPAGKGVLVRILDKLKRLQTFLEKGKLQVDTESADDAVSDIINYAILLKGLIHEDDS